MHKIIKLHQTMKTCTFLHYIIYIFCIKIHIDNNYFIVGAIAASGYYTDYTLSVHIVDLNCTGEENSIWDCSYNVVMNYTCPSSHDASLQCQGNCGF